jgi:hypothetical protein
MLIAEDDDDFGEVEVLAGRRNVRMKGMGK